MLEMLKLSFLLKWLGIYLLAWAFEEIVIRLVVYWIFGPKDDDQTEAEPITS
jgi:hypothetical protein